MNKYTAPTIPTITNRQWPNHKITKAPTWLSLDLASAARSLIIPMDLHRRLQAFQLLQKMGFKQIAVGMPGVYEEEAGFFNRLVQDKLIHEDVAIQISTPVQLETVEKTFANLLDASNLIIQLHVCTSPIFRELHQVDKQSLLTQIQAAAELMQQKRKSGMQFAIALEGFSATEPEFVLQIWQMVKTIWQATSAKPVIFHCVATLQYGSVNQIADYMEWVNDHLTDRESAILSFASQNNRNTAVAAAELVLLAGVERIGGSLAGIAERSGIIDTVCVALNLFSQGINPNLDFGHCDRIIQNINAVSNHQIPARHPYLGELAFSAVRKSQHDVIKRCIELNTASNKPWSVPYLSLDPADINRSFETINAIQPDGYDHETIRIIENYFGFHLPNLMQTEFCNIVHQKQQTTPRYFNADDLREILLQEYTQNDQPLQLLSINFEKKTLYGTDELLECRASAKYFDEIFEIYGQGNGAIDTLANAIKTHFQFNFDVSHYSQHALTEGTNAMAATYIKITGKSAFSTWGLGIDSDSTLSGIKGFMNALNRTLMLNP